ncbi:MAG: DMT family transporter [Acidimicrobiales bacterium]
MSARQRRPTVTQPRSDVVGAVLAVVSGVSYGFTVLFGKVLARDGVDSATALSLRFLAAAGLVAVVQALRRGPLRPASGEWLVVVLLGGVGYAIESMLFYLGLQNMGAAAVGLVFYSYPAFVAVADVAVGQVRPTWRVVAAVALSILGVAGVVAAGGDTRVTALGVVFALGSAVTFTVYMLASHRFVRVSDPWATAVWLSLGAGVSHLARGVVSGSFDIPAAATIGPFLGYGVATGVAFAALYAGLPRLGPTRTAVLLNIEVVTTVVLAAVFLDERLLPLQLAGGVGVALGAVFATLGPARPTPELAEAPAP